MVNNKLKHNILIFVLLIACVVAIWCKFTSEPVLVNYLENISPKMKISDIRNSIPKQFFVREELALRNEYVADRVFTVSSFVSRILIYEENRGDRFADAQIFFGTNLEVIGVSYTAEGMPPLKQTIFDGVGPRGSRKIIKVFQNEKE